MRGVEQPEQADRALQGQVLCTNNESLVLLLLCKVPLRGFFMCNMGHRNTPFDDLTLAFSKTDIKFEFLELIKLFELYLPF